MPSPAPAAKAETPAAPSQFMAALSKELGVEPPKVEPTSPKEEKPEDVKPPTEEPTSPSEPATDDPPTDVEEEETVDPATDPADGEPSGKEKTEDPEIERMKLENERLRLENERLLGKPKEKKEDPDKKRTIEDFSEPEIIETVKFWKKELRKAIREEDDDSADAIENNLELARKELARREARAEVTETKATDEHKQQRAQWDAKALEDFPEIVVKQNGKDALDVKNPLVQASYQIWVKSKELRSRPDGSYRALELAWAQIHRKNGKAASPAPNGNGHNQPKASAPPPAMKGKPSAAPSGNPPSKDAAKAKKVGDALANYEKTGDRDFIADAIKAKIGG